MSMSGSEADEAFVEEEEALDDDDDDDDDAFEPPGGGGGGGGVALDMNRCGAKRHLSDAGDAVAALRKATH